jgi:hypothetical protein
MHSSISSGRTVGRIARVAGMGVMAGLIVAATSSWLSCSPGELDCSVVNKPPCTPVSGAGGTGGDPPMGGTGGGTPGGITLSTPIAGCSMTGVGTVGDFETKFIVPRCGKVGCHTPGAVFQPDMAGPEIFKRLVNRTVSYSMTTCNKTADKYIDTAVAPEQSFMVIKVRDPMPKCPSGAPGGLPMPFGEPALNDMEKACVLAYVKAVSGKP